MHHISIIKQHEGHLLGKHKWSGSKLICDLQVEPLVDIDYESHDYNLHFNFGLHNHSEEAKTITVIMLQTNKPVPETIWQADTPYESFQKSAITIETILEGYKFDVTIDSHSETYLSNTMWSSITAINQRFHKLEKHNSLISLKYGQSANHQDLLAYKLFDKRDLCRPLICISSGSHPAEGDTIATAAIAEWITTTGRSHLKKFDVLIVPILNPDGFITGTNGCNTNGINFFWDFQHRNLEYCPEAYYFWELLKAYPPNIYIDFHCYSTQGKRKTFGPYLKPLLFYSGYLTRNAAQNLANSLQTIPGSKHQTMFSPSSMPHKITQEFNTITFAKYHLHQAMGKQGMSDTALLVMQRIIDAIDPSQLQNQIFHPHGPLKKPIRDKFKQKCFMYRYYLPKTIKKLFRS